VLQGHQRRWCPSVRCDTPPGSHGSLRAPTSLVPRCAPRAPWWMAPYPWEMFPRRSICEKIFQKMGQNEKITCDSRGSHPGMQAQRTWWALWAASSANLFFKKLKDSGKLCQLEAQNSSCVLSVCVCALHLPGDLSESQVDVVSQANSDKWHQSRFTSGLIDGAMTTTTRSSDGSGGSSIVQWVIHEVGEGVATPPSPE
jgi:hypothetical protein